MDVSDALVFGRSLCVVRDRAPQRFMEQNIRNFWVFKVYPQDKVLLRFMEQNFKVYTQDRVLLRFVKQNFKIFQQDRAPQRLVEQNIKLIVAFPKGHCSPAFGGAQYSFLHHGFLPGSSSIAFGEAQHLHHLPPSLSSDGESSGVDGAADFRPMRFCMFFGSGTCFKGNECTFAHAWEELHPDSPEWGL